MELSHIFSKKVFLMFCEMEIFLEKTFFLCFEKWNFLA